MVFIMLQISTFSVAAYMCSDTVAPPGGGKGGSFPLWVDVQKLRNMCVLSLSWNFFVSQEKIPNPTNSLCTVVNVSASGGLRTLDPL